MFSREGRVNEIVARNKELGGLLNIFADLPPKSQEKILQEVARLKKESEGDPERFMEEVKALASMYGAVIEADRGDVSTEERQEALTARIEEIQQAAKALRSTKKEK